MCPLRRPPSPRAGPSRAGQCLSVPLDGERTVLVSVQGFRGLRGSRGAGPLPAAPPAHQAQQDQGQRQAQQRGGAQEQRREWQRGLGLGGPGPHRLLRLQRRPGSQAARAACWRGRRGRSGAEGREERVGEGRREERLGREGRDSRWGGGGAGGATAALRLQPAARMAEPLRLQPTAPR